MIRPLRKLHFYGWILIGILLPVGFISAYLVIPDQAVINGDIPPISTALPLSEIIFTKDMSDMLLNIRQENDKQQIELVIKKPLTVPNSSLYLSDDPQPSNIDQMLLLGSIETRGIYRFNYPVARTYLLFYDGISQRVFNSVKLK